MNKTDKDASNVLVPVDRHLTSFTAGQLAKDKDMFLVYFFLGRNFVTIVMTM